MYAYYRHGSQERVFRMEYVSNSPFTESEFSRWKSEVCCNGAGICIGFVWKVLTGGCFFLLPFGLKVGENNLPSSRFVQDKLKEINEYKNCSLNEDDIDKVCLTMEN